MCHTVPPPPLKAYGSVTAYSQRCVTITTIHRRTFSPLKKKPTSAFTPWSSPLLPPAPGNTPLFYISVDLPINGTLQHVVLCDRLPSLSLTFARSGVRFCRKCILIFLAIFLCILHPFPLSSLICLSY